MQFDLKRFMLTGKKPYEVTLECELSDYDWPGYTPRQPIIANFKAVPTEVGVDLKLTVDAVVDAECARCLEPVSEQYAFTREWTLRQSDLGSEELELPLNENFQLDLDELVFEELVLEVPPMLLCSEDCQGLCPVCGKPKAAGCTCSAAGSDDAPADDRLAILKELLS